MKHAFILFEISAQDNTLVALGLSTSVMEGTPCRGNELARRSELS